MSKTHTDNKRPHRRFGLPAFATLLIAVTLAGLVSLPGWSAPAPERRYTAPETVSPFSRTLQGLFGLNTLARWVGSQQVEKEIRKKVDGPMDVDLEPYSAFDLKEGKARKLSIVGHDLVYDKAVHISEFAMETDETTPLWINLDNGKLRSPLRAKVSFVVSEADMNKTLASQMVSDALGKIKVPILTSDSQTLKLIRPVITFSPGRLRFQGNVGVAQMPEDRSVPLDIQTGLEPIAPENTRIGLKNLRIAPISGISNTAIVEMVLTKALSKFLNPSKFIPMDNGTFYVEQLAITEDAITVKGRVLVLPEELPVQASRR